MLMLPVVLFLAINIGIAGSFPVSPENITVTFLTSTSVRVSWQTSIDPAYTPIEKFDVAYKPSNARVVVTVAAQSEAVILTSLSPNTQYQLSVTAVCPGHRFRSRQVIFRTLEPRSSTQGSDPLINGQPFTSYSQQPQGSGDIPNEFIYEETNNSTAKELPTIRGVEVGIVVIVLMVWAGAIALFFNRWGKIRMLLPYQPDYKQEQLKVPGTGVCSSGACNGQHSHQLLDVYNLKDDSHFPTWTGDEPSTAIAERCTRNRINSAIFVSSEGKGFDSIEFLRRYGSQSVLCRKAKSAENITSSDQKKRFSDHRQDWDSSEDRYNDSQFNETVEFAECYNNNDDGPSVPITTAPTFYLGASGIEFPVPPTNPSTGQMAASATTTMSTTSTALGLMGSMGLALSLVHSNSQGETATTTPRLGSSLSSGTSSSSATGQTVVAASSAAAVPATSPGEVVGKDSIAAMGGANSASCGGGGTSNGMELSTTTTTSLDMITTSSGDKLARLGTTLPTLSVSEPSPPHDKVECL